jgi:endogenous inhibitor of DNA gyrase (YacG/DUF329 family)
MKCPICKAHIPDRPPPGRKSFLPFCSQRCRLIDLGRWLGGKYQIPVRPDEPDDIAANPPPSRLTGDEAP